MNKYEIYVSPIKCLMPYEWFLSLRPTQILHVFISENAITLMKQFYFIFVDARWQCGDKTIKASIGMNLDIKNNDMKYQTSCIQGIHFSYPRTKVQFSYIFKMTLYIFDRVNIFDDSPLFLNYWQCYMRFCI